MGRDPSEDMGKRAERAGRALMHFGAVAQGYRDVTVDLVGFSIRCPKAQGGEFLMTLRGSDDAGAPLVAFHTSDSLEGLWNSLWVRYDGGDLRWKADEWER